MAHFSERELGLSSREIVDDAPSWVRLNFFDQILSGMLFSQPPFLRPTSLQPLSARLFVEKLSSWMQASPDPIYRMGDRSIEVLRCLIQDLKWFYFYDTVELAAAFLHERDRDRPSMVIDPSTSSFRQRVNSLFEDCKVGWALDENGFLRRKLTKDIGDLTQQVESAQYITDAARIHLAKARRLLDRSTSDFENSIKESLCAMESLGRKTFPNASTFGDVLKSLRHQKQCPDQLVGVLQKAYDFSNAAAGVRHARAESACSTRGEAEYIYHLTLATMTYLGNEGII